MNWEKNKKIEFLLLMAGKDETLSERRVTEILPRIGAKNEI